MKKIFSLLTIALTSIVMFAMEPQIKTFDFGTPAVNPWNFPTAAKVDKTAADTVSYTYQGSQITLIDTQTGCQILCDTGLLIGAQYAGIVLPVMDFPVGKIVVNYDAKMDANTEVAVTSLAKTSGGGIVIKPAPAAGGLTPGGGGGLVAGIPYTEYSTARLKGPGADNTQTFSIKPEYTAAGTQYVLRVTTANKYMLVHSVALYEAQGVESVALDNHKDTIKVGEKLTLAATILPEGAMYKSAVWSTTDNSLASVSTDGKVSAKAVGDVEIIFTVTTLTDAVIDDTCRLHINPAGEVADDFTVVYDFTSNDCWGLPTTATDILEEYECESAGASFSIAGAAGTGMSLAKSQYQYVNNSLKLAPKNTSGTYIQLQQFPFAVGKIVVELDPALTSANPAPLNVTDGGVTQTVLGKTSTVYTSYTQYENVANVTKDVDSVMTYNIKPDYRAAFTDYFVRCFNNSRYVNIKRITVYKHIAATKAAFAQDVYKVSPNKTLALDLDLTPVNTTAFITFTSMNPEIATVDANGVVTAGGAFGTTKIIMDADGLKDTCDLEVCIAPKKVIDFTSNDCWGFPTELTTGEAEYTCNGQTVVVNGASGLMAGQGGYNFDASTNSLISWVALSPKSNVGFVKLPQFDFPVGKFVVNMTESVTAKCRFTDVGKKIMTMYGWTSYTDTVAGSGAYYTSEAGRAVGLDYYFRPTGTGKLYIKSIEVYEYVAPETVALNQKNLELEVAETANLSATVTPIDATYKAVTYTSLDTLVAKVDATGLVTAVAGGTTSIIATVGALSDTCNVSVVTYSDRRIFAYDLRMTEAEGVCTFAFKTNIAPTAANIVLYRDGAVIDRKPVTVSDALTYSVAVNKEDINGKPNEKMAWGVEVKADKVKNFGLAYNEGAVARQRMFIAMDKNYESPYFGRIYSSSRATSTDVKAVVYGVDGSIINDNAFTLGNAARPGVDDEGTVYWADYADAHSGIWVMNPETYATEQLFQGTRAASGLFTNAAGVAMCGSTMCAEISGKGADTKLWISNEDAGTGIQAQGLVMLQLGQNDGTIAHTWAEAPTLAPTLSHNAGSCFDMQKTERGLWWCQNRTKNQNADANRSLMFINNEGEIKWVSDGTDVTINGSNGGGMEVNADESKVYMVDGDGNIMVMSVVWNENVPTLSLDTTYATEFSHINTIILDPAGNLVTSSGTYGTNMRLVIYGMPTDNNEIIIPAAKSQAIEFAGLATLDEAVAGKTIRRVVNDNTGVYALAVDAAGAPTLVKADFEGNVITTYATDFCKHLGTAAGTLDLADIALTSDGVLLGINAEHNTTTKTIGQATLLYKWNADGTGAVLVDFDNVIGSANNPVAGNFSNATTDMLAFNGTLANGVMAVRAMTQGFGNRSRIGLFQFTDGAITKLNAAKDLESWTATSGIYMTNALTAGNFVWSAAGVSTIEFASSVALLATEPEAIEATAVMDVAFNGITGYTFATISDQKVMIVPSATDVKLYNVASGLGQAASMSTLTATQTVENPQYIYAGYADGKIVLVRDGVVETIIYSAPVTGLNQISTGNNVQKVILNGVLYIIRDSVMYNVQGLMVK